MLKMTVQSAGVIKPDDPALYDDDPRWVDVTSQLYGVGTLEMLAAVVSWAHDGQTVRMTISPAGAP